MRLFAICLLAALTGCTVTKNITVNTRPAGARIEIDGFQQPPNAHTFPITWENDETHNISAELAGYVPKPLQLRRDDPRSEVTVELKPLTRAFTININPPSVPALIKIDNQPVDNDFHTTYTTPRELDVSRDPASGKWKEHTVTAEREGFKTATATMKWSDGKTTYDLTILPMDKDFSVTTIPPGAAVFFDNDPLGTSPIDKATREFAYDVTTNQYLPHKLKATLPGYPEAVQDISYDAGQTDYQIRLEPSKKTIHIHTTPPGGIVTLDGQPYKPDANGETSIALAFPPAPGTNVPKVYTGEIHKPKTADTEWYPRQITIKWDGGQPDYSFALQEIRTMPLPLLSVEIERNDTGWQVGSKTRDTVAGKSRLESHDPQPVSLTPAEIKGKNIDSLAISPDGKKLLFTVLEEKPALHSLMYVMPSDGSSAPMPMNDGSSLDISPSFSPDGEQILFSSDRAGNRLILCGMSASGGRRIEQYTTGQTTDWWPSMDSSPKPRIFYEARSDRLQNPSIYSKFLDTSLPADLNVDGGMKPRINAQNDALIYERYNEHTRKRDLWRMSDGGASPVNLTNSPDDDDYDASWDRVGARIAFASDAGVDEDKNHNYDIWILDLTQANALPQRVTSNPSHDDHPVWDPSGKAIYFRSNRGGAWGIWKIAVK